MRSSGAPAEGSVMSFSMSMSMSLVVAGDLGSPSRPGSGSPGPASGSTGWSLLPQALLEEVLRWLPIKSHLRFRSVSKLWYTILTSPSFLRDCAPPPTAPPALLALQACFGLEEGASHPYPLPRPLSFHGLPELRELPCRMHHCASDAGLVCFLSRNQGDVGFYMLNPLTRTWRNLPPRKGPSPVLSSLGLLVDRIAKAYTLVVADCDHSRAWTLHVYQAREDAWEEARLAPERLCPDPPAFCRGLLYFLASDRGLLGWSVEARKFQQGRVPAPAGIQSARLLPHRGELLSSASSPAPSPATESGACCSSRTAALLSSASFHSLFAPQRDNSWSVLSLGDSVCLDIWLYDVAGVGAFVDAVGGRVLLAYDFCIAEWFVMPLQFHDTSDTKFRVRLLSFEPRLDSFV